MQVSLRLIKRKITMDNTKKFRILTEIMEHMDDAKIEEFKIFDTGYAYLSFIHDGMEINVTIKEENKDA